MKIILEPHVKDAIHISKINPSMIIVGRTDYGVVIITNSGYKADLYKATLLNDDFTINNGFTSGKTVQEAINNIRSSDKEFHAFTDYRDALKWVLEQDVPQMPSSEG